MALFLAGGFLFAQEEESLADKLTFSLEFEASVLSANKDGADSMTDAGFNEDETKFGVAYEDELWGAGLALNFGNENLRFLDSDFADKTGGFPLAIDELYGWVRPFGGYVKFTGGIFENTDGLADYTDDIDDFPIGVFLPAAIIGEPFGEPEPVNDASLTNGLLTDLSYGPVTLQFLLAPNYSKESASELITQMMGGSTPVDAEARFFRFGGRAIVEAGEIGTFSALFKTFQWPAALVNAIGLQVGGSKVTYSTFGAYFDLSAVENLGVSLGYTGFLQANDGPDVDNVLYSGVDLRGTWTGIEGLSLSSHNNLSFAKGSEKDWFMLQGDDSSFIFLYNAVGATKELTEKFSVNAEISNVFSSTELGGTKTNYDSLGLGAKLIAAVGEHAEFNAGSGWTLKASPMKIPWLPSASPWGLLFRSDLARKLRGAAAPRNCTATRGRLPSLPRCGICAN
jgi:hypothetical protein